jgi:hypothetical protein
MPKDISDRVYVEKIQGSTVLIFMKPIWDVVEAALMGWTRFGEGEKSHVEAAVSKIHF